MLNRVIGWKFWLRWVLINALSFPASVAIVLLPVGFAQSKNPYMNHIVVMFLAYALIGVLLGLCQFLVLRGQIPRMSIWWSLTNSIGLPIAWIVSFIALMSSSALDLSGLAGTAVGSAIAGTTGGIASGVPTGIAQWLLLRKWI